MLRFAVYFFTTLCLENTSTDCIFKNYVTESKVLQIISKERKKAEIKKLINVHKNYVPGNAVN